MTNGSSRRQTHLLALAFVVAVVVTGQADGAHRVGAGACALSGKRTTVGAVTRIFHTSLFVRGRYVSVAPCDLAAGDELRTDTRGEALFQLSAPGLTAKCVIFPLARVRVSALESATPSTPQRVATFFEGRTWCSTLRTATPTYFAAGLSEIPLANAVFSIEVANGTVLVKVGAGSLTVRAAGQSRRVRKGQAVLVSSTGTIKGPQSAQFDARDALALARLR